MLKPQKQGSTYIFSLQLWWRVPCELKPSWQHPTLGLYRTALHFSTLTRSPKIKITQFSNCNLELQWLMPASQQGQENMFQPYIFLMELIEAFLPAVTSNGTPSAHKGNVSSPMPGHFLLSCLILSYCSFLVLASIWTTPLLCLFSQMNTSWNTFPLGPLRHLSAMTINP